MITAEVKDGKPEEEYPCLMMHHKSEMIVLFVSPTEGTVVSLGKELRYFFGEVCIDWNISCFVPFTGSVTLRNG